MKSLSLNALFIAALGVTSSFASNIVLNPSFESGNLNQWVSNTQVDYAWELNLPGGVTSGCIGEVCVDQNNLASANYLYQNLATQPGTTYKFSFDFAGAGSPAELKVLWAGSVVLNVVDPADDLTQYTVSNLYASGWNTQLMFLSRQDPGFNYLTNISVDSCATPEPGMMGLLLGGLGVLGALRFRRKQ